MKKLLTVLMFVLTAMAAMAAKFEKPIMLTSVGQSADVQMVKALLKKGGLESEFDKSITAEGLTNEKTLILAIGGSSKGLGAAGIKVEDELDRTAKLIKGSRSINSKYISVIFPIPCAISPIIVSNFIFEDTPKIRARRIIKSIT